MSAREILTTVDATATAETRYKTASFTVTTHSKGPDTAAARKQADQVLTQVMKAIKDLNTRGAGIDTDGLKCSYSQQPWQEHDRNSGERIMKGYQVTGSIVCSTETIDAATLIQDALSKIDGASVQQPTFLADDSYDARQAAFKTAFERANEDFRLQCRTLGLNPDDYEIVRYSPTRESYHGGPVRAQAAAMMAEAPEAAPAEIKAGRAEISAYVSLTFAKKAGPKTRASGSKTKNGGRTASADAPTA